MHALVIRSLHRRGAVRHPLERVASPHIATKQAGDAADVPITHTFGPNTLVSFKVWTDEVT